MIEGFSGYQIEEQMSTVSMAKLLGEMPQIKPRRIPKRKRLTLNKQQLRRVLAGSREYQTTLSDGTRVTDWNRLLEDYDYKFQGSRTSTSNTEPREAHPLYGIRKCSRGARPRAVLYQLQEGRCFYCQAETPFEKFTVDHRIALARGGSNRRDNKVGACSTCNHAKGSKLEAEFLSSEYLQQRRTFVNRQLRKCGFPEVQAGVERLFEEAQV